jgi:hypothetical protein
MTSLTIRLSIVIIVPSEVRLEGWTPADQKSIQFFTAQLEVTIMAAIRLTWTLTFV